MRMKLLKKIFPLIIILAIIYSCAKDGPANNIEGTYTLSENSLIINDIPVLISDFPYATIEIIPRNNVSATLYLRNIIPGFEELPIDCIVSQENALETYSYKGEFINNTIEISIEGIVKGEDITLYLSILRKDSTIGKWALAEKEVLIDETLVSMPDIYINLTTDVESLTFKDKTYSVNELLDMANIAIKDAIVRSLVSGIEFTPRGYFNLIPATAETDIPSFNNLIQFYTEDNYLALTLRKSIIDGISSSIFGEESLMAIPSPIVIKSIYQIGGTESDPTLNLVFDKSTFGIYVSLLNLNAPNITNKDLASLGIDVSESDFLEYKAFLIKALEILLSDKTTYEIGINFKKMAI